MNVRRTAVAILACLSFWMAGGLAGGLAQAHVSSTGLAQIDAGSDRPAYRLTLIPSELGDSAADMVRAAAGDAASSTQVAQWLRALVRLSVDGRDCAVTRTRIQGSQIADERVTLLLDFSCPAAPGLLQVGDRLHERFGEHYRTIVSVVRADGQREERVFDKEHPLSQFDLARPARSGFLHFVQMGAEHMLSGLDHLLFLAALLAGSRGLRGLLIVVTTFTLAHSVSLALSVLDLASLSPAIVEPMIAASIVWVAVANLRAQSPPAHRYALAFVFGLIHGMAFAEGLTPLQLRGWPLAQALLGFNLGVEAAQALVVLLLAPVIAWLGQRKRERWLRWASIAVAALGAIWFVERIAG